MFVPNMVKIPTKAVLANKQKQTNKHVLWASRISVLRIRGCGGVALIVPSARCYRLILQAASTGPELYKAEAAAVRAGAEAVGPLGPILPK